MTKYHRSGIVNNRDLFFHSSRGWKSQSQGTNPLPGAFSLCPYVVEGVKDLCEVCFIRTLIPFMKDPLSHELSTSERPHGGRGGTVRILTYESGEVHKHSGYSRR